MQHKLALAITAALMVAASTRHASANTQWVDGPPLQNFSPACGAATVTRIGYLIDPAVGLKTGDVTYVHVFAIGGCANDTVGWDMFLGNTAVTAVDAQHPVFCFFNNSLTLPSTAKCSQTPATGNFGGPLYGFANLTRGQTFEIQIPVKLTASGTIEAAMESAVSALTPTATVPVSYRPLFENMQGASSPDGTSANVGLEIDHFFVQSQVVFEYGAGVFDHATPAVTASAMYWNYPNVTANLPGTTPGTLLTWRVRITNQFGTFYSATQSVALANNLVPIGPPRCLTRSC